MPYRKLLMALLMLGPAACATWEKPGATPEERRAALARCEAHGAQIPPEYETFLARPGYWEPSVTECSRDGRRCWTLPGGFRPPEYRTRDRAAALRETVTDTCMQDQGWARSGGL